ncbi:MAG: hypothetical protein REI09_10910 [Candidatus Dactylopiibacterium sp.]|nr:hypothetical protein [Candidatus Dactylopiibacterium sp.]
MQLISTHASPSPRQSFGHFLAGIAGMALAAALLAWEPAALATRWHPAALAAVHLCALGGLMPVMLGALFQFVPVACGLSLPDAGRIEWLRLAALEAGAVILATGFVQGRADAIAAGGTLALASLAWSAARLLRALHAQPASTALPRAMRRAALALAMTLALGGVLVGILRLGGELPFLALVDWHAQWALAGWVGGLILAVAGVVVPMFHVTAPYPARWEQLTRALPWLVFAAGAGSLAAQRWLTTVAVAALCALAAGFGVLSILRVRASRRGERDAFHYGWLGAGLFALLAGATGLAAQVAADPRWSVAFGVIALGGLGGITITVMLYRIVPFLIWLHWQRANRARARLPLLHQIVPARPQAWQLGTEAVAVGGLALGAFLPETVCLAAILLFFSKSAQFFLVCRAIREFSARLRVLQALPPRPRAAH